MGATSRARAVAPLRLLLLGVAIALTAFVGSATASPPAHPIDLELSASVTAIGNDNSCCVIARDVDGTVIVPSLGRLHVTGEYDLIAHYGADAEQMSSHLFLTFTDPSGATFGVVGDSELFGFGEQPPASPWTIVGSSGRLSWLTGSGSYTVSGLDTQTLDFSLSGTLGST
jgi:hypothetical protein